VSQDIDAVKRECADLITAFNYFVDHHEFDKALALFTEDAVFERPDLRAEGRAQIAAIWAGRPATTMTRHLCDAPHFLEINNDSARAVTPGVLYQASRGENEKVATVKGPAMVAEFHDTFARTAHGWKIAHRRGVPIFMISQ
jgi:ketosteroid isomerase-like protein